MTKTAQGHGHGAENGIVGSTGKGVSIKYLDKETLKAHRQFTLGT